MPIGAPPRQMATMKLGTESALQHPRPELERVFEQFLCADVEHGASLLFARPGGPADAWPECRSFREWVPTIGWFNRRLR